MAFRIGRNKPQESNTESRTVKKQRPSASIDADIREARAAVRKEADEAAGAATDTDTDKSADMHADMLADMHVDKVPEEADQEQKSAGDDSRKPGRKGTGAHAPRKKSPNADEDGIEIYDLEELTARRKAMPEFPDSKSSRQERDWGDEDDETPRKKGVNVHLILWAAIVVILLASVIIYLIWSRGTDAKVKEGEVTNSYSVEVNDEMVYLSEAKLEGHQDDGITTILCLGNEPFSDDMTETGLAGQIRELADNVEVINASFPNSQVTCYERKYDPSEDTRDDIFNLFYVANSINIGDYSAMETVASFHEDDDRYADAIKTLKQTDWENVDMIAIMYDAIDYRNGASMQNPDDGNDLTTYTNCLKFSFQLIQEKYPWIRIVFLSPYYINEDGVDSRTNDIGNGTLVNYFQWAMDTCADNSVSFLDNYYGSVNENNYKDYTSDGLHLNEAGRTKVADHFVYTVINKIYTEYDAGNLMVAGQ